MRAARSCDARAANARIIRKLKEFPQAQGVALMAEDILKVERHPNYATITLNRPEKRNSLNEALLSAMDKAFASIEEDKEIRAVILRGAGKSFCAGLDLAEADRLEGGHTPGQHRAHFSSPRTASGADHRRRPGRRAGRRMRTRAALRSARRGRGRANRDDRRARGTGGAVRFHPQADRDHRRGQHRANPLYRRAGRRSSARSRWGWCTKSCPTTSSTRPRSRGPRKYQRTRRSRCAR